MTHDDHIDIVGNHDYCVLERLALALAGVGGVRETDHLGSQTIDGCLETEPGPGRRFEEKAGYHLAFQEFLLLVLLELLCSFKHVQDLLLGEIPD